MLRKQTKEIKKTFRLRLNFDVNGGIKVAKRHVNALTISTLKGVNEFAIFIHMELVCSCA